MTAKSRRHKAEKRIKRALLRPTDIQQDLVTPEDSNETASKKDDQNS